MHKNRALFDRMVDIRSVNDNAVMMYRGLISLIEEYNRMARDKGLPTKKIPVYSNNINHALIKQLTVSILKDIDRVKNIKGDEDDNPPTEEKTARDVEFTIGTITELPTLAAWKEDGSLWYYTQDGDNICVYADTEVMKAKMNGGTTLELDYEDMPYELLVDTEGREYKVNKYCVDIGDDVYGLFGHHSNQDDWNNNVTYKLTALTIKNWTNKNITTMRQMFGLCENLTTLNLSNFNTSTVTTMQQMFLNCYKFTTLDLSEFDTTTVTDMDHMFLRCNELTTLTLGENFNTALVENTKFMFNKCDNLISVALYSTSSSIVKELPSGTWTVDNDNDPPELGTVVVSQGTSATWNQSELPNSWGDEQWTLSRTIQSQ